MNKLKIEAETIQISIYCEIIMQILTKHNDISVYKMLVFAYLIKKDRFTPYKIYNGNSTQDIIYKCISMITGEYKEFCNSIQYIIKAIHLLGKKKLIIIDEETIYALACLNIKKSIYGESTFIEKAIEASKTMTDKQFMKEVVHNV